MTLIEQQTLLALEVKRKQTPKATPTAEKQKETKKIVKQIDQPILEPIDHPILENKQQLESQIAIIVETLTEEGQGSIILTPEQRLQYEKQWREWRRQREEEEGRGVERKREEERKTKYDNTRLNDNEQKNIDDQEATFDFPILDISAILGEEVKMKNIPPSVLSNFYGVSTEDPDSLMLEFDILCRTYGYTYDTISFTSFLLL